MARVLFYATFGGLTLLAGCTFLGEAALEDKPSERTRCVQPSDCATNVCNDGFCDSCTEKADCVGSIGTYCNGSSCVEQLDKGAACAQDAACLSGFCVDGVCCESACNGECEACTSQRTGGQEGTCEAVITDTDPDDECSGGYCNAGGECCGASKPPTSQDCPAGCNGGCEDGICVFNVNDSELSLGVFDCPVGFDCEVYCFGTNSCSQAAINCPKGGEACRLNCTCSGTNTNCCAGATLTCGNGPCDLTCAGHATTCSGTEVVCGTNKCAADCANLTTLPSLNCNSSCDCTSC